MPDTKAPLFDDARLSALMISLNVFEKRLATAFQRLATAVQPIAEAAHAYVDRPEIQAKLARVLQDGVDMHNRIEAVDAPGYTPYFERMGYSGFEARLHAGTVRGLAKRSYEDAKSRRIALMALHDLAKRPRWHPALVKQATRLDQHGGTLAFLDEAFRRAGCPELRDEAACLLLAIRDGNLDCGPRLLAIVARIAPHLPSPRGRPVHFDTVLHRTFLEWSGQFGGRDTYTYGPVPGSMNSKEDFTDPATAATRIELRRPRFSPVAARRSGRTRRANAKS